MISSEVKSYLENAVLCWLATVSPDQVPNVSPKEIFTYFDEKTIIIANIASPQSLKNILKCEQVCLSFLNIFIQKGFKIKGIAKVVQKEDAQFLEMEKILLKMTDGLFPFSTIFAITVSSVKPVIAPRYRLFPDTTEEKQISSAVDLYNSKLKAVKLRF